MIHQREIKNIDSVHIACAIKAKADYFLTTDDGVLKKAISYTRYPNHRPNWVHQGGIVMITDTEIKVKGIHILAQYLGDIEAERFIALIQREPFDYTKWRQDMDEELNIEEISRRAMSMRRKNIE